jgi:hypothetical protein
MDGTCWGIFDTFVDRKRHNLMVRNTGMAREETNKVRIENKSKQTKCLIMVGTSPSSTFLPWGRTLCEQLSHDITSLQHLRR